MVLKDPKDRYNYPSGTQEVAKEPVLTVLKYRQYFIVYVLSSSVEHMTHPRMLTKPLGFHSLPQQCPLSMKPFKCL